MVCVASPNFRLSEGASVKKLTLRNYLGYASGDLANNLAFSLQALFLLIYYTNVWG